MATSTNSTGDQSLITSNGMVIISGSIPDNSERDARRCVRIGCTSQGARRCVRRYCKSCCQSEPLEDGTRCSYHKGTTPQQLRSEARRAFDAGEDDPLDVNITYSRNLQREWQELWSDTANRALSDKNYRTAGQRLTRSEFHRAVVWVYREDGQDPEPLEVDAPSWPFFHPQEVPSLAQDVLVCDDFYWRYEEGPQTWWKTHRSFRVDAGLRLYTRVPNVTNCPGLPCSDSPSAPSTPAKRPLAYTGFFDNCSSPSKFLRFDGPSYSGAVSASSTPSQVQYIAPPQSEVGSSAMKLLNLASRSSSRSPTRPSLGTPSLLSNVVAQDPMSPVIEASLDNPFIDPMELPLSVPTPNNSHTDSVSSIPPTMRTAVQNPDDALDTSTTSETDTGRAVPSSFPSPSPSVSLITNHAEFIPLAAPIPPSESSFPLTYVCDMRPLMSQMVDSSNNDLRVDQRFAKVFAPFPYRHGTYYDARRVYKEVPRDVQERFSGKGRTLGGQWSEMVTWWNVNINKGKKSRTRARRSTGGI